MNYSKAWRQAAREAMSANIAWTPTNLPRLIEYLQTGNLEKYSSK